MCISILVLIFSVFTIQSSLNPQNEPEKHKTGRKGRKFPNLRYIFSSFSNDMITFSQINFKSNKIIIFLPHSIYTFM